MIHCYLTLSITPIHKSKSFFDFKWVVWIDAVIEHDAVGVVDFVLDDDGLAFNDVFLFTVFCRNTHRHARVADHIAWDIAVYRDSLPRLKRRILNEWATTFGLYDFLKTIGFFW